MTSWRHGITHMKINNIFELRDLKNRGNKKKNQLSSTSTTWDRWIKFSDVMIWRHDVTASHKWKTNNIFELSDLKKTMETKKESIF